ncbi:MAG: hypothetical protein A2498_05325 [Lentisphaerae bacterium RIFOXYC12_FULL_60_16]|nr:MAG: hypothetical protein A2498_05325 [Lentisphaerae bacterium RIFOXYC12_FULL_60_16]OGV71360.1 MAG: hypothetical protein A2269_06420 [Lentisphaerae bacterium RIFOXYA12_FULL_60_10]OGV86270.1 MAG: hypothetical protein A2340_01530 [Lentisphaerae bacterium RIFOXYB12_FULL_60_10]
MNTIFPIAYVVWLGLWRRKDAYVLLILMGAMLLVLSSLNVFGLGGKVVYIADIGLVLTWLFSALLAVQIMARELPAEQSRGTIHVLLAKPVTRFALVLGKWLGAWAAVSVATLVFYGTVAVLVYARGGHLPGPATAQALGLHITALAIITAITLIFSTRMNHDAAAAISLILTGAAFLVIPRIPEFVTSETGFTAGVMLVLYHALPHFELFDLRQWIIHDFGMVAWPVYTQILLYGLAWITGCILVAWMTFRRRHFSRGDRML